MKQEWWHSKCAYQIYPKSFCDTDSDGIGDLKGILSKLDYLKALGIDILWISPIYQSPFVDQGYDISDYYKIAPEFGTMEDFEELLAEAQKRGISVLMDLVVNHCSDRHQWFQNALADPYGKYAGYFYFEKGKDGKAPSNYRSYFGGSTWDKVPGTDLYYLHLFAKEQPDLNWENPALREEIYTMVNWWLDKGLAGFRIDAIINIKKELSFPDFPADGPDGLASCIKMVEQAEGVGSLLEDLKRHTFAPHNAFTVAEVFNMREDELSEFIGDNGHFSTMFDFSPHTLSGAGSFWYENRKPSFEQWRDSIIESQLKCRDIGFLANIIENHDEPRGASRYLPAHAQNDAGVKMLGTTTVLLRGLPFLYQGQEIGMRNCPFTDILQFDDINTIDQYQASLAAGLSEEEALAVCNENSRDNARTPMQWDAGPGAGFTAGTPWLRLNPNYKEINVAAQEKDPSSVLHYYRRLIALRKSDAYREVFTYGDFVPVCTDLDGIFAYLRRDQEKTVLVAANYGARDCRLPEALKTAAVLLDNMEGMKDAALRETPGKSIPSAGSGLLLHSCQAVVALLTCAAL